MLFEFLSFLIAKCIFFCSSIGGDSFPKPLTKEQEETLIYEYKNGDLNARDQLISHNLRLVAHIAKKYQGSDDSEDLISVGTIGLIKAINTFEPGKGTHLATYTARCIENEILMLLRSNKKRRNDVSISEIIGTDKDGNELSLIDLLADGDKSIIAKVEESATATAFKKLLRANLNDREYKIIVLRYGIDSGVSLPQREVAKLLKISRSYVSRIEKKAIDKLKLKSTEIKQFSV